MNHKEKQTVIREIVVEAGTVFYWNDVVEKKIEQCESLLTATRHSVRRKKLIEKRNFLIESLIKEQQQLEGLRVGDTVKVVANESIPKQFYSCFGVVKRIYANKVLVEFERGGNGIGSLSHTAFPSDLKKVSVGNNV